MTESRSSRQKRQPKKQHSPAVIWVKRIILSIIGIVTVLVLFGVGMFAYYASSAPSLTEQDLQGAIETKIYDKNGDLVTSLGGENREIIVETDIPQQLKDAVTAIEDQRFYSHIGVDPIRIAGSFIKNIASGKIKQGGSTITQQLIKLSVFSTSEEDQTYKRKAQEAVLALGLEKKYTKDQILTFYLNKVYLANNIYGFGTASHFYFNKDLKDLSIAQTALLAGMPQAPTSYDPYVHPEAAQERRNLVLQVMYNTDKITKEQYDAAVNTPISDGLVVHNEEELKKDDQLIYDSFLSMLMEEVKEKTGLDIYKDGLTIETTLDTNAQKRLYDILNTTDYIQYISDDIQSAVTVLDTKTGAVRAINGGRKPTTLLGYNRATSLERSTGSTIKPIIDYGPAIEYLEYSTGEPMHDVPTTFSDGNKLENWDKTYMGDITLRRALYLSRNTTAFEAFKATGADNITSFLKKLDIEIENDGKKYLVDSNSIGANISPLKMAAAYAAFGNNGTYSKPYTATKVTTRDGQVFEFKSEQVQAMKDSTAYMITDILKDSFTKGFTTQAYIEGVPQAGKTGSSNYTEAQLTQMNALGQDVIPDSWMVGYSTDYTISVWTGYDNPYVKDHGLGQAEQMYARRIYYYLMSYLSQFVNNTDWQQPNSVQRIDGEVYLKGQKPKYIEKKPVPVPTGLNVQYDTAGKRLTVTWNPQDNATFTVTVGEQSQTVQGISAVFENIPASDLTISLTATVDGQTSQPANAKVNLTPQDAASSKPNQQSQQSQNQQQNNNDD